MFFGHKFGAEVCWNGCARAGRGTVGAKWVGLHREENEAQTRSGGDCFPKTPAFFWLNSSGAPFKQRAVDLFWVCQRIWEALEVNYFCVVGFSARAEFERRAGGMYPRWVAVSLRLWRCPACALWITFLHISLILSATGESWHIFLLPSPSSLLPLIKWEFNKSVHHPFPVSLPIFPPHSRIVLRLAGHLYKLFAIIIQPLFSCKQALAFRLWFFSGSGTWPRGKSWLHSQTIGGLLTSQLGVHCALNQPPCAAQQGMHGRLFIVFKKTLFYILEGNKSLFDRNKSKEFNKKQKLDSLIIQQWNLCMK